MSRPSPLALPLGAPPEAPSHAPLTRRAWVARAAALLGAGVAAAWARPALADGPAAPLALTVYKDPACGCCEQWVAHMAAAGFRPAVHDVADLAAVKARLGVPASLHACHTAEVGGVVVEGHVPPADVQRFLKTRPRVGGSAARGLAVPGMPAGSPGMDGARADRYTVLAFGPDGTTVPFAAH